MRHSRGTWPTAPRSAPKCSIAAVDADCASRDAANGEPGAGTDLIRTDRSLVLVVLILSAAGCRTRLLDAQDPDRTRPPPVSACPAPRQGCPGCAPVLRALDAVVVPMLPSLVLRSSSAQDVVAITHADAASYRPTDVAQYHGKGDGTFDVTGADL